MLDDLSERILTAGLLDPPQKKLGNMLTNLETLEFEPYPEGEQYMRVEADTRCKFCCPAL